MHKLSMMFVIVSLSVVAGASASALDRNSVDRFIDHMVMTHKFDKQGLMSVFSETRRTQRVLDAISRPAEALPWYKYRQIFIRQDRIENGVSFWEKHAQLLERAEKEFGVPPQIIVAIIGVETSYGGNKGNDRVMDALSTLAFHYPKRGSFFRNELEQFLLLTREQALDPLTLKGSYAGAMGMPQFIPSSYRSYAIDFDSDGKIDIWNNTADVIGSVANYFKIHGWEPGENTVIKASVKNRNYVTVVNRDLKPSIKQEQLSELGILPNPSVPPGTIVKIISLDGTEGEEIWLGLNNFYVITRYNHSELYAMAVYQLSQEILDHRMQPVANNH